ncbi:G protein-coupled receptor associated sorting protein 3-like [Rhynchocyon petersi]
MAENKARVQAKTRKGAAAEAEAEREAPCQYSVFSLVAKTQTKARSETAAVAKKKAGSRKRVVAQMKARMPSKPKAAVSTVPNAVPRCWTRSVKETHAAFGSRAENKVTGMPCCSFSVARTSGASKSAHREETEIDAWFWDGEEANIGAWFWGEEEGGDGPNSKNKDRSDFGAKGLGVEPVTGPSCKPRPGAEEEEEEADDGDVIGSWFWEGDEPSFDPNPRPVYRIPNARRRCRFDENCPRDRSEVSIWPNAATVIPAVLAYGYQVLLRTRPLSYIPVPSAEETSRSVPEADAGPWEGTSLCLQSIQAHPFDSEICTKTIEKIRCQIKVREVNGIKPFACPCKMECCLDSEEFEKLVSLLKSNADPVTHKIAQIAMGIIDVHPFARQFINELGVLTVIESLLEFQFPDVTKKAEITLNPISAEERQRMVELHVVHMCREAVSFPLNSPGQQSGLKELGQLTTNFDHHFIVAIYLTELFQILAQGDHRTRKLVLKILLNMSDNPTAAIDLIDTESLSVLKLIFTQKEAKANLVTAVAIFINIKEHIRKGAIIVVNPASYNELKAMFREVKMTIERM